MKMIELDTYEQKRRQIDKRQALYFGTIVGGLIFLLFILSLEFLMGIVFGGLAFGFIFGLVFVLTGMQHKGVVSKLKKLDLDKPCFEGNFVAMGINERGLISLLDDKIVYQPLLKMPSQKQFEIDINEDLFMGYGPIKMKKRHVIRYNGVTKCHLTFREMPHGVVRQFIFFDIDNLQDKVGQRLNEISQFNAEKYQ